MAKTKKEEAELAEEQRRQQSSVVDLAREDGMKGNAPGGATVDPGPTGEKEEKK